MVGSDGKPQGVSLRVGITDGTYTEVLDGDLKEQQEVIIGSGTRERPEAPSTRGPRLKL